MIDNQEDKTLEQSNEKKDKTWIKPVVKWGIVLVLFVSIMLNVSSYAFPVVRYHGKSMMPTIKDDQVLLLHKSDRIEQGDIIGFYYGNKIMVRRVIGLPGDIVDVDIFGQVTVNGEELTEPYVEKPSLGQTDIAYPYVVPANSYFVMGDERDVSMDSRLSEVGSIAKETIVGKLCFSIWPIKFL